MPPRVSTWIGIGVALAVAAGEAAGAGEAEPGGGGWGVQPASSARPTSNLTERIGAYYGECQRNDLEPEREEQADRIDPAVDQQGMHGSGVENLLAALPAAFPNSTMPELVLIGAEIGQIAPFTTVLSPAIAAAITQAVNLVMLECTSQDR